VRIKTVGNDSLAPPRNQFLACPALLLMIARHARA
jgi:hypothetical protein